MCRWSSSNNNEIKKVFGFKLNFIGGIYYMFYKIIKRFNNGKSIKQNNETGETPIWCMDCPRTYFPVCEDQDCQIWNHKIKPLN
jgi:hypothetical protein